MKTSSFRDSNEREKAHVVKKKFFNSAESIQIQREKDRIRKLRKRRVARIKLEEELHAHLQREAAKSQLAAHLVSRIQFEEPQVTHSIESLIEDAKFKAKIHELFNAKKGAASPIVGEDE